MNFSCYALKERYEALNRKPHVYDLSAVLEYDMGKEHLILECSPYDLYEWLIAVRGSNHKEDEVYYESDMGDGFSLSLEFNSDQVIWKTEKSQLTITEIELHNFIKDLRETIVLILKEWYSTEEVQALSKKYLEA